MGHDMTASTVRIKGFGGDEIEAYLVRPHGSEPMPGIVVVHHMPGWDRHAMEVSRRFAEIGYDVICPNLYWRDAPGAAPEVGAAAARAAGGVPDDRAAGDLAGSVDYLRGMDTATGKVGVIGYCSGGRQTVLLACRYDIDAAAECYAAFVTGETPPNFPIVMPNLVGELPNLKAPLLGLFGGDDQFPSPAHVEELGRILTEHGKDFEFHTYEGASHSFFWPESTRYVVEAANAGWVVVERFFAQRLAQVSP